MSLENADMSSLTSLSAGHKLEITGAGPPTNGRVAGVQRVEGKVPVPSKSARPTESEK